MQETPQSKCSPSSERTRRPRPQSALLICHVDHLHLGNRIFPLDPVLRLAALDFVDKLLQLVSVRHPVGLARQIGKFTTSFFPGVSLAGRCLFPFSYNCVLLGADLVNFLNINTVPKDTVDEALKSQLALLVLCLAGWESIVGDDSFLGINSDPRGLDDGFAHERARGDTDATIGEAKCGLELVVALVVNAVSKSLGITANAFLGTFAKEQTQGRKVVGTHGHNSAARQIVVEVNLVLVASPPRNHGSRLNTLDLGGFDERAKESPRRIEAVVESLEQHRSIWLVQLGQVEENLGLGRVGRAGLLKKDMLASANGTDSPLKVKTVGQGDEDGINVGIIEDF